MKEGKKKKFKMTKYAGQWVEIIVILNKINQIHNCLCMSVIL